MQFSALLGKPAVETPHCRAWPGASMNDPLSFKIAVPPHLQAKLVAAMVFWIVSVETAAAAARQGPS